MKEKKYRKFEFLNEENKNTDFLYFNEEKVVYQKFTGNVRGYDIIIIGGIKRSEEYGESEKYFDVETIEDPKRRKEITDLLVDKKKSKKNQEAVYFHNMEFYRK